MTTYQIAILGHYYHPDLQGERKPSIHCDDRNNPIEYETIDEAREVIREWDGYEDFCAHIDGDNCCGECQGCIEHMIDADREYLLSVAVYKS